MFHFCVRNVAKDTKMGKHLCKSAICCVMESNNFREFGEMQAHVLRYSCYWEFLPLLRRGKLWSQIIFFLQNCFWYLGSQKLFASIAFEVVSKPTTIKKTPNPIPCVIHSLGMVFIEWKMKRIFDRVSTKSSSPIHFSLVFVRLMRTREVSPFLRDQFHQPYMLIAE